MTIDEVRDAKGEAEDTIHTALTQLMRTTGLAARGVNVRLLQYVDLMSSRPQFVVDAVTIEMEAI